MEGDLAVDPTTEDMLGCCAGFLPTGQLSFFSVDLDTGAAELTTPIVRPVDYSYTAIDASGTLYAINTGNVSPGINPDELHIIDRITGDILQNIPLNVDLTGGIGGMDFDPFTGIFYVMDGRRVAPGGESTLYTLNVLSGELTKVGDTPPAEFFTGIAVVPGSHAIPAPAGIFLLIFGLVGIVRHSLKKNSYSHRQR